MSEGLKPGAGAPAGKDAKAPPAKDAPAAGAPGEPLTKAEKAALQYSKELCLKYVELSWATWFEEKAIDEFWTAIPKSLDADGKPLETVSRKDLKEFVLQKTFEKQIKKTRLDVALETAPHKQNIERYETILLDFLQNDFLADVTLLNGKTNAAYK